MQQNLPVRPLQLEKDLKYAIALGMIPGIGPFLARQLVIHIGSAKKVFQLTNRQLCKIQGIGIKTAYSITNSRTNVLLQAEEEITFCREKQIRVLSFNDALFPAKLRHCHDSPFLLYMKGNTLINSKRIISIVGSRKASSYGKELTRELVASMAS